MKPNLSSDISKLITYKKSLSKTIKIIYNHKKSYIKSYKSYIKSNIKSVSTIISDLKEIFQENKGNIINFYINLSQDYETQYSKVILYENQLMNSISNDINHWMNIIDESILQIQKIDCLVKSFLNEYEEMKKKYIKYNKKLVISSRNDGESMNYDRRRRVYIEDKENISNQSEEVEEMYSQEYERLLRRLNENEDLYNETLMKIHESSKRIDQIINKELKEMLVFVNNQDFDNDAYKYKDNHMELYENNQIFNKKTFEIEEKVNFDLIKSYSTQYFDSNPSLYIDYEDNEENEDYINNKDNNPSQIIVKNIENIENIESIFENSQLVEDNKINLLIENITNSYKTMNFSLVDCIIVSLLKKTNKKVRNIGNFHHLSNILLTIYMYDKSGYRLFEILFIFSSIQSQNETGRKINFSTSIQIKNFIKLKKWLFLLQNSIKKRVLSIKNKDFPFDFQIFLSSEYDDTNDYNHYTLLYNLCKSIEKTEKSAGFYEINRFIQVASSYKIPFSEVVSVLSHFSTKGMISNDAFHYFSSIFKSNTRFYKDELDFDLDYHRNNQYDWWYVNDFKHELINNNKKNTSSQLITLLFSSIFLKKEERINLLLVNKDICYLINSSLYKKFLIYGMSNTHSLQFSPIKFFKIWRFYLYSILPSKYFLLKKRYSSTKLKSNDMLLSIINSDSDSKSKSKSKAKANTCLVYLDFNQTTYSNKENPLFESIPNSKSLNLLNPDSYSTILQESKSSKDLKSIINLINLDVERSFYKENEEERLKLRRSLYNILVSLSYSTEISYCQGMNYIGSFILSVSDKENQGFELLYLLFQSTEYKSLFEKDLFGLRKLFFIFKRSIELIIPYLSSHFIKNHIGVSLFSSSWIITLFTVVLSKKDGFSLILYYIFSKFLVEGWFSIVKFMVFLLFLHEDVIIYMNYEQTIDFLLNKIYDSWVFSIDESEYSSLFSRVSTMIESMRFTYELYKSLENEYDLLVED